MQRWVLMPERVKWRKEVSLAPNKHSLLRCRWLNLLKPLYISACHWNEFHILIKSGDQFDVNDDDDDDVIEVLWIQNDLRINRRLFTKRFCLAATHWERSIEKTIHSDRLKCPRNRANCRPFLEHRDRTERTVWSLICLHQTRIKINEMRQRKNGPRAQAFYFRFTLNSSI